MNSHSWRGRFIKVQFINREILLIEATRHFNYVKYTTDHIKSSVYPKTLEVKAVVTSTKYDWVAFLSMVGGVMGMLTGF